MTTKLIDAACEDTYKINKIFYSIQTEGLYAGQVAGFVRFSGCSGEACNFCDTDHHSYFEYTTDSILEKLSDFPSPYVVLTGGEPMDQLNENLLKALHQGEFKLLLETNGSIEIPEKWKNYLTHITVSPKTQKKLLQKNGHTLKVVFPDMMTQQLYYGDGLEFDNYYAVPCDNDDKEKSLQQTIDFCKLHPKWRLCIQTHKLINIE